MIVLVPLRSKPLIGVALGLVLSACQPAPPPPNLGGDLPATPAPAERLSHSFGASLFNQPWVSAPSTTGDRDGLGPLFNAHSCRSCHHKLGRGTLPRESTDQIGGLIFRLADNSPAGNQLQTRALPGFQAEGRVSLSANEQSHHYPDGSRTTLRTLTFEIAPQQGLSPRLAPALTGMGLIDAIDDDAILAGADPDDRDSDGISGRALITQAGVGRFGWKAQSPTLEHQVARAFVEDMGITSRLFPQEPGCPQPRCELIRGGAPEISDQNLKQVTDFLRTQGIPRSRLSRDHRAGWQSFNRAGCAACHQPEWRTGDSADPRLTQQQIYPFSDFLLHNMGPELADTTESELAAEWRTAPLWALGEGPFLHDGRARTLEEAILWHGGEAAHSREKFRAFTSSQRQALIEFLRAL